MMDSNLKSQSLDQINIAFGGIQFWKLLSKRLSIIFATMWATSIATSAIMNGGYPQFGHCQSTADRAYQVFF